MKIGLFTSVYFNNIGNGFIDLGAEATLKETVGNTVNIIKVSQCANFAASMGKTFLLKENPVINWCWVNLMQKYAKKLHDKSYKAIDTLDVFSCVNLLKFDYFIIPGCVLTVPFFTIYGKVLKDKVRQGCKLIFLGASGNFYTDYEINFVKNALKNLNPYAIITRDSIAYKHYKDCALYSYNGIDNVFFVNKLKLPKIECNLGKYDVVNLEEPKNKKLKNELIKQLSSQGKKVIITNHKPFPYSKISKLVKEDKTIISDYPLDYLHVYNNVDTVYSDRVHACIPTLSFGNKAVLYSDSPRKSLFDNVEIVTSKNNIMSISNLEQSQANQILFLQSIIK